MIANQLFVDRLVFTLIRTLLGVILLFGLSCSRGPQLCYYDLPTYDKCTNVKSICENDRNRKLIYCEIEALYPAKEVILFYNHEMRKRGLIPFSEDGYGLARWEIFNVTSGDWEQSDLIPGRYIATWVDEKRTIRIVLSIRYVFDAKNIEWDKKLIVNLSVQPFFFMEVR